MTENSAIFNARRGAGSFRPHRQPAPTAQDCQNAETGQIGERPGSYLVNVGLHCLIMAKWGAPRIRASRRGSRDPLWPTISRMNLAAFWSAKATFTNI